MVRCAVKTPWVVGRIQPVGWLPAASNGTLLVTVPESDQRAVVAVYKPVSGMRALHDFDAATLPVREVAAYELSEIAGFGCVPPTVWTHDGPLGPGSVQRWVGAHGGPIRVPTCAAAEDIAEAVHHHQAPLGAGVVAWTHHVPTGWAPVLHAHHNNQPITLSHARTTPVRRLVLFDAVTNNTDRKAGHIVPGPPAQQPGACDATPHAVLGIDHGLTFHTDPKLRTVLWGMAGAAFTNEEVSLLTTVLELIAHGLPQSSHLGRLQADELTAITTRTRALLSAGTFPHPTGPGPTIPWPPM